MLQTYIPKAPLADYVHMFWYWAGYHPPHKKERILPHGLMEMTINLADEPLVFSYPEDGYVPHPIYGPIVAGARSDYFVIDTNRPASILSVWFKAGGARAFFGASANALHNQHLSLDVLWGYDAHDLYCQLLEAPSTVHRFRLLETALTNRLKRASVRHRAVDYALNAFSKQPHNITIAQIVDEIALSPTRFIQVFREEIGITPKLFCRVQRFQHALSLIAQQRHHSWTDVALRCGYFDQAHFINDFQHFAGITPTMYAPQSPDHNSNLPFFE
ncbi:MAG: helix-turn-helix transcriptional regulator [Aggregatilineales bacterium]